MTIHVVCHLQMRTLRPSKTIFCHEAALQAQGHTETDGERTHLLDLSVSVEWPRSHCCFSRLSTLFPEATEVLPLSSWVVVTKFQLVKFMHCAV